MFDLKLGQTYRDYGLYHVLMKSVVPENDPKYQEGYRFIGSNGSYYRPDGTSDGGIELESDVTTDVSRIVRSGGRVVATQDEAMALNPQYALHEIPHGSIQWKGTGVCIDMHCRCGYHSHVDAEFMYYFECPACHRTFVCESHIELIEYTGPSDPNRVQPKLGDDGIIDVAQFEETST